MDKMREEFEAWAKDEFDIDCSEMSFGVNENDKREQYHNNDDPNGAITVSAMFCAWKASRAALCVEISEAYLQRHMMADYLVIAELDKAGVSYK